MEEARLCASRRVTLAHEPQRTADEILTSAFERLLREYDTRQRNDENTVQARPQQQRLRDHFLQEVTR
jgi:hypothetical protein